MSFHQVHGKNRGVGRQASVKCIFDNRLCAASSLRGAFCLLAKKNLGKMNCNTMTLCDSDPILQGVGLGAAGPGVEARHCGPTSPGRDV